MMTKRKNHDHDHDHDGELLEREAPPQPEAQAPEVDQLVLQTSGSPMSQVTVTVANPTPPTNISYVSTGTPPVGGVTFNNNAPPTLTGDAALFPPAGVSPPVNQGSPAQNAGSLTAVAAPSGGSGPVPEATGTVVVDADANNTNSITVMGNYTNTPNASHPSANPPSGGVTITGLVPASTLGDGGEMTLTVNGTGFEESSIVNINGVPNATEFISATQLQATNAPKRTTPGTTPVTVVTEGSSTAATNWTFT